MSEYIDLTGYIENGLWGYYELPGLEEIIPETKIEHITSVKQDGCFISKVTLSTITGTYLEAGSHILEDGKNLDEYELSDFIKPVKIIKLPKQEPNALIDSDMLQRYAPAIEKGDALAIDTGWGTMWNKPGYVLECPNFLNNALQWILDQKISILAVDVPCIEASWAEDDEEAKGNLLAELFLSDALLAAPLVGLQNIKKESGLLYCIPLALQGTSGAPARIFFYG